MTKKRRLAPVNSYEKNDIRKIGPLLDTVVRYREIVFRLNCTKQLKEKIKWQRS